jgi:N6-adenosine-specific RNA methylase IME4
VIDMATLMPGHAPLKFHPLANLFPMLSEGELDDLAEDIRANGQVETVKLHRGMVLDGRNRYTACQRKGLPVRSEVFEGTDREALAWVISKNLKRRHLTESQRAMVAAKLATLKLGDNQHTTAPPIGAGSLDLLGCVAPAPEPMPIVSQSEAADLMNVGRRSVQRAAVVQEKGAPELQSAVETGKIAASTAAELAEALPAEEQKQVAQMSEADILAKAKEIRKDKNDKRRAERVEKLKQQAEAISPLPTARKFPIVYFDPATKFAAGDSDRSTENHYLTMTEEDLAALPIADLATDDAALFMWSTVPWLAKSLRLLERWGFDYKSAAFWDKIDFGLGFWWRDQVEVLLVATRGKMVAPENGSVLGPNLYREKKGRHSAKPTYFRDLIGNVPEYRDLPKVELFARTDEPLPDGWYAWGAQANVPQQQSLSIDGEEEAA